MRVGRGVRLPAASTIVGNMQVSSSLFVGCPVHVKWGGVLHTNWVGYIRRINWDARLAEVGPETCIGSHLRPYELNRLVPAEFTRMMHPQLPAEIDRLQRAPWSETGSKSNMKVEAPK